MSIMMYHAALAYHEVMNFADRLHQLLWHGQLFAAAQLFRIVQVTRSYVILLVIFDPP